MFQELFIITIFVLNIFQGLCLSDIVAVDNNDCQSVYAHHCHAV